jgi:hypothetical protein
MSEQRCTECAHALWRVTANGRLHPSGDGRCAAEIAPLPTLPKCRSWAINPRNVGGWINRRQANHSDCPLFEPKEDGR